jgi:hypothetical protein
MRPFSFIQVVLTATVIVVWSGCGERIHGHATLWMSRSAPMALEDTNSIVRYLSFEGSTLRLSEIEAGKQRWCFAANYPPRGLAQADLFCFAWETNLWRLRSVIYAESVYAAPLRYHPNRTNGTVSIYSEDTLIGFVSNQKAHEARELTLERTNSIGQALEGEQ